jgi:hypothetical protein
MALTSTDARQMWQRVADGRIDQATDAWIRNVAKRLTEEIFIVGNFDPASKRAQKALKVIGYSGRVISELEQAMLQTGARPAEIAQSFDLTHGGAYQPKKTKKDAENILAKHRKK